MTDDAPTPDGTHHDEDAVAAPQTADDRPSLPEDDSPVLSTTLSTTTPDAAGEPRPEDDGADAEPDDEDSAPEPDDEDVQASGEAEAHSEEEPKVAEPEPGEAEVTEASEGESDDEPEPADGEDVQAESGVPEPDADVAPTGSDEDAESDAEPEPAADSGDAESAKLDADGDAEPDDEDVQTAPGEAEGSDAEPGAPESDGEDVQAESGVPEPDADVAPTGSDEDAEPDDEDVQTESDDEPEPADDEDVQTALGEAESSDAESGVPESDDEDVQAESGEAEAHSEEEPKAAEPEPGEAEVTKASEGESDDEPEPADGEDVQAESGVPEPDADVAPTGSDEDAEPDDEEVQAALGEAESSDAEPGAPESDDEDAQAESGEAEAHSEEEPKAAEPEPNAAEVTEAPESEPDAVEPAGPGEDAEPGAEDTAVTPVAETLAAMSARTPAEAAAETPTSADSASAAESGDAEPVESDADAEAEPAGGEGLAPQSDAAEVTEAPESEPDAVEPAGPGEDAEPGAEDTVATPVAETLAAMSARTPAEAATETPEAETPGPEASAESAAGASAAEAPSGDVPATAAVPVSSRIGTILAKIKAAPAGLLHGRRPGRGVLAGIIGVGLLVLVWGGAAVATTQHIFAGSTVSGVDVGDMSPDEARQVVADQIGAELAQPAVLSVDEFTDTLVPADSGVAVDAAASIDRLTGPTINPVTLIKRLSGTDVHAVTTVDSGELTNALNARLGTLATGTADAVVTLDGTTPVVTPGADGTGMDVDASVKALSAGWPLGQETIDLVGGTARPAITDDDAKAFVDSVLTPLLSDSLTVTAAGTSVEKTAASRQVVLSPDQIAALTVISTEGGELSAVLDSQRLHDTIIDAMGAIETAPTNAGWTIDGSAEGAAGAKPQYVAPSPGEGIDMDALTQQLVDAGTTGTTSDGRTVALTMITTQPEITTPEKDWGITEVTGEFSTPFSSEPGRDQNLIRGAEQMNGQIVMPGETFSVEQALGPVDYEHGFTDAGVISNGQHVDALGGGLSQIGTTMFNVGFEAGMDDIEHHPHSYYFDRYPAGREATLWTGQKDVKFANSTPYAALIQAWVADGEVHTRIWSTHYYDVSITSSERYNYRPVQTITRPAGAGCQAYSGGNPGFDITVTRTRTAPDKAVPDDVLTTTYDADNNIACGKPGKTR